MSKGITQQYFPSALERKLALTYRSRMINFKIIDHPIFRDALSRIRDASSSSAIFRSELLRASRILAVEALKSIPTIKVEVDTPLCKTEAEIIAQPGPVLVPILRAGLGFVEAFTELLPEAMVAHIGVSRDHDTLLSSVYSNRLPSNLTGRDVFILDPMLATANSATAAVELVSKLNPHSITLVCLVAAPEGIEKINSSGLDLTLVIGVVDEKLNENGYIVPGLGDAGDRLFGT